MVRKLLLSVVIAASFISPELCGSTASKKKSQVKNNSGVTPAGECGTWVKEPDGGYFTSPNYPEKYPPDRECVYIIEASPRQCIDLFFDEKYSIEPSWECKFDHIEVRDGPFVFSPIIGRYCGQESPTFVRSSGRYLYIKFVADGELEAIGFSARYNFTHDPEFTELGLLPSLPFCEFDMTGPEGFVESHQITRDNRALQTEAVDCRWYIRAPPKSKIYMRFLEYEMHNSNECKRNFVAIYDGSSSVEHLKNKFCSTVANDVMLESPLGVVRLWADEGSRKSKFRILFTTFHAPPCDDDTFFCHSNMCINHTLVCNGVQNCVYPWDENHCKEKRKPSILDSLDNTNLTIIGVTCGLVVILLVISVIIQIKQPRKKYIIRRDDFDPALLHPGFEPPHYELCTLRRAPSGDLTDSALAEDFHKLRRSSSKCIRDHHCGAQQDSMHGSAHGSRSNLSMRDGAIASDGGLGPLPLPPPMVSQQSPLLSHHTTPTGRRNILVMKHSYSQDGADGYRGEEEDSLMMDNEPTTSSQRHMQHQQIHPNMSGLDHIVHRTLSNDF
ncbi:neuropilin and tolloid-like protein 1 [Boleophthalmus pectinirostris]|uniref:neuropilin and tolloid-like protein 1 n=1 Tax=Boleophthalmus pectinirostris TaxID=150288 RepID=UPI00242B9FB3|nr:neuropilin and tolloid-like protein 1 [Boleophthalmus pectinirostris]